MGKFPYIPLTDQDFKEMLSQIGVDDFESLLEDIPKDLRFKGDLKVPSFLSEEEVRNDIESLANKNKIFKVCFAGAGSYDHIIPSIINHILLRSEFYTAYTPYQAEVSQGTLQAIYEYQSLICRLMNMEITNASMYDSGSAVAEAIAMGINVKKKKRVLISSLLHPFYRKIVETYLKQKIDHFITIEESYGITDIEQLRKKVETGDIVVIQHPNFLGFLEDMEEIKRIKKEKDIFLIEVADPVSLSILKPPGDYDVDVAVAEGQPFGIPMAFGGPYLGIFSTRKEYVRYVPGRLVGMTEDIEGKRGFVLTLQTREQHIKRERATSNICTNQALCALAATIFLSLVGKTGFIEIGEQSLLKSHYLFDYLNEIPWVKTYNREFFKEFAIVVKNKDLDDIYEKFVEKGILPGVPLRQFREEWNDRMLIAVTEKRSKEEIDTYIELFRKM